MKGKKILVIVIIIVAVLAVVGTTFTYLFLATDILKGTKELFAKYITQNFETYNKLENSEILNTYNSLKNEDKYLLKVLIIDIWLKYNTHQNDEKWISFDNIDKIATNSWIKDKYDNLYSLIQ